MIMKKKSLLISALVLVLAMAVFGTLAFFTAEDDATNIITMGNIKILLIDDTLDDEEEPVPFPEAGVPAMPGTTVDKIVQVKNVGDNPAYVRVKLTPALAPVVEGFGGLITFAADTANWEKIGDWYHYKYVLAKGDTTPALITQVVFSNTMGNDYQDAVYTLLVEAQGVQSENNGTGYADAAGWPTP
jgi:predicted ribosomally synthesized peptide with SipW-like signal peptide